MIVYGYAFICSFRGEISEPFDVHYLTEYNSSGMKNLISFVLKSSGREGGGYSRCAMRQEHLSIFLQSASSEGSLCQTAFNK